MDLKGMISEKPEMFKCWLEGVQAFEAGKARDTCPYSEGDDANEWYSGFDTAAITITGDIQM
jgi:ribosome modulation factor